MVRKSLFLVMATVLILTGASLAQACEGSCGCKSSCGCERSCGCKSSCDCESSCGCENSCGSKETGCQCGGKSAASVKGENKICPVMGGAIIEGSSVQVEHEGKIYNLCCAGCIETFKSGPETYIEKINSINTAPVDDVCSGEVRHCEG